MASIQQRKFWRDAIEQGRKQLGTRGKQWTKLLNRLDLDYTGAGIGLSDNELVKISRFYPLTRQLIAAVAFNYPRVFIRVEDEDGEQAGDILERAGNTALRQMGTRDEVWQIIFDALYCGVGWLKMGYNPPGDQSVAPYVANDVNEEDFPYVQRISPHNVIIDPLTPPHKMGHARYMIERMLVPLEFVRKDDRYTNRNQIQPFKGPDSDDELFAIQGAQSRDESNDDAFRQALESGKMALLWEVHDRLHQKRLTFADGVEQPIEEIDHPFLNVRPIEELDPLSGEVLLTGEFEPTGGYLVENGFPYFALKFDMTGRQFIPAVSPMGYVDHLQNIDVEAISRSLDIFKRTPRLTRISPTAAQRNPEIRNTIKDAKDGESVIAEEGEITELNWGHVPPNLENLTLAAEQLIAMTLGVSELQQGGGPKRTATEAALISSSGAINREWMQVRVADCYRWITHNAFNIMGDPRYTPERFIVNVAPEGESAVTRVLQQADFLWDYRIEVEAGSMQPLIEEKSREDVRLMFGDLRGDPDIDQIELKKMYIQANRVKDVDKLFNDAIAVEAVQAAQNENTLISLGQPAPVAEGQDHLSHLEVHSQAIQEAMQTNNVLLAQAIQGHMQAHQQAQQQELGQATAPASSNGSAASTAADSILGTVQSNAQRTADAVQEQTEA